MSVDPKRLELLQLLLDDALDEMLERARLELSNVALSLAEKQIAFVRSEALHLEPNRDARIEDIWGNLRSVVQHTIASLMMVSNLIGAGLIEQKRTQN